MAGIIRQALSNGAASNRFGWSVSVSFDTAVIGASWDNDKGYTGQASGSAYLFTRDVVDGVVSSSWTQRAKLVAADGAAHDEFGRNVSICNNTVVAGAWGNDAKGAAYVFTRDVAGDSSSGWTQRQGLVDNAELATSSSELETLVS